VWIRRATPGAHFVYGLVAGVVFLPDVRVRQHLVMGAAFQLPRRDGLTAERSHTTVPLVTRLDSAPGMPDMFSRFLGASYPVFLDSALVSPGAGRFSYLTADPFAVITSKGRQVRIDSDVGVEEVVSDPFDVLQELLRKHAVPPLEGLPPFQGGAVGYLAYELAHQLESLPRRAVDDLCLPEMAMGLYDWVIARDHATGETWAVSTGLPERDEVKARSRLKWIEETLSKEPPTQDRAATESGQQHLLSGFTRDGYLKAVEAIKHYIASGDVYQVNISQRLEAHYPGDPWALYLRLRHFNPAPFAAYLQYPDATVLSASPEMFLNAAGGHVQTRPMKGTRPRGEDGGEDLRLRAELQVSEKDRAENVMIVDVLRNDLGRVCIPGSIEVPDLFTVEIYPTVFQMVSTVRGRLLPDIDAVDLLKACFPGGSVTGAPKIRAMEIIDEMEPTQRSVYCGAIGYLGFGGAMLASVPIRIVLVKGQKAYVQVGGGVIADSDPEAEYEESLHKARGSLQALAMADRRLNAPVSMAL
jgi:para-aminobenzoate synthetase component 1